MTEPALADENDADAEELDLRCHCGRLLARRTPEGVQIKCARCKRVSQVTWLSDTEWERSERSASDL